jgi:hypothetical protein
VYDHIRDLVNPKLSWDEADSLMRQRDDLYKVRDREMVSRGFPSPLTDMDIELIETRLFKSC